MTLMLESVVTKWKHQTYSFAWPMLALVYTGDQAAK